MIPKTKKRKKSPRQMGSRTHGHGAMKRGSGHRGGVGMAGTGKRADHKKTLMNKLYGNKYFGKQGITSKRTAKRKLKTINIRKILEKFAGKKEIKLKEFKILGDGEIDKAIVVHAKAFTKSAKEKIEKAGGKVIVVGVKEKLTTKLSISTKEQGSEEQKQSEKSDTNKDKKKENRDDKKEK